MAAAATHPAESCVASRASTDRLVEKKEMAVQMAPRSPAPCFGSHSGRATRLPEAHQLYSYGQREVGYARELAVPQYNRGIAIVHDIVGPPPQLGHQIVHSDEAIQNSSWSHVGPMLRVHDGSFWSSKAATDAADFELKGAQWSQAVDVRGLQNAMAQRGMSRARQAEAKFHQLYKVRTGDRRFLFSQEPWARRPAKSFHYLSPPRRRLLRLLRLLPLLPPLPLPLPLLPY
eukprot:s3931_g10.t1